ncbi:hypothetical protein HMPREF1582_01217 [Gardnerella vaginalis JCP8151A]|nr:hypothetical protein HMPREF1582_01217 [Gardnerella vaginalis JCP8151A]
MQRILRMNVYSMCTKCANFPRIVQFSASVESCFRSKQSV